MFAWKVLVREGIQRVPMLRQDSYVRLEGDTNCVRAADVGPCLLVVFNRPAAALGEYLLSCKAAAFERPASEVGL